MTDFSTQNFELLTPRPAEQKLPGTARLGAVHLDVTDGSNSKRFWTHYIGLTEISDSGDAIELGIDGEPLIVLHPGATSPVVGRRNGLYHVAIHVPTQKELARLSMRLYSLGWEHSPTDHAETMATYTSDPDGNGIEITFETPERGSLARGETSYAAVMADGTVQSGTEPLDVDMLLSALDESDDVLAPMPSGTRIGHVHMHVNDIVAARDFYINQLGLGDMRWFQSFRMSDFSLLTSYVPHAIAINTWNGTTAQPRPEGTAGLREWQLIVDDSQAIKEISERLSAAGSVHEMDGADLLVKDPAGNLLRMKIQES
jgi:catechol 2,3-dioxygenase